MITQEDIDRFQEMGQPRLIGISGYAGSGKSQASKILKRHGFTVMKLAGPLKDMSRAYLLSQGVHPSEVEEMIEGSMKELPHPALNGASPRAVMQHIGNSFRVQFGDDFWTNAWRRGVAASGANPICCDDVRYANEIDMIHDMGGIVIRVTRPGVGLQPLHKS